MPIASAVPASNQEYGLDDILARLRGVREVRQGAYEAFCPACETDRDGKANRHLYLSIDAGKVLFNCQHRCDQKAIQKAIGLPWNAYFASGSFTPRRTYPKAEPMAQSPRTHIAIHRYEKPDGSDLHWVHRYASKPKCLYCRPGTNGQKEWNLNGVPYVPFNVRAVLATGPNTWVWVAEGEKNAEDLIKLGLVGTTNRGGAKKWRSEYDEYFKDKRVAILGDYDKPGQEHVRNVARHLHAVAQEVRVIDLPGIMLEPDDIPDHDGKDVSDWLDDGHTVDELLELVQQAPVWQPPEETEPITDELPACTDAANGQLFADLNRGTAYWVDPWGTWLMRTDACLKKDTTRRIDHQAVQALKKLLAKAHELEDKKLASWAHGSLSLTRRRAMLESAKSLLAIEPEALDSCPMLLNCRNGVFDLATMKFREHQSTDLITQVTGTSYDPEANCPLWIEFLNRVMGGNSELIAYLQTLMGHCLTGDISEQIFVIFYGIGANGKSVFTDTMMGTLGDYATKAPSALLEVRHNDEHPTAIASLFRKRLVVASEMEESRKLRVQLVKELTGDKSMKARLMRQDYFEFDRTHKIILVTNHKPIIRDSSIAIWRRVRLIPFTVSIPPAEQDHKLLEKLQKEWSGILNWAIAGCQRWLAEGLHTPDVVKATTDQYEAEMDPLADFLADRCVLDAASSDTVGRIKAAYSDWAEANGERYKLNRNEFKARLEHQECEQFLGPDPVSGKKARLWKGIRLKTTPLNAAQTDIAWGDDATKDDSPY